MRDGCIWLTLTLLLVSTVAAQQEEILLQEAGVENAYPRLFNDGKRILYQSNRSGNWQLYILDIATEQSTRITNDKFNNNFPDLSADNEWVAFVSDRDGNEEIYIMRIDGSELKRLTDDKSRDIHPYFSPDGSNILFNSTRGNGSFDVFRIDRATGNIDRITDTAMDETCARYSPDMKKIVMLQNGISQDDVVVLDRSTGLIENVTRTPKVRDGWPMYSADGKWIYYSTMINGRHSIHRLRPDGSGDETMTTAAPGEEDGRAFIGNDGRTLIYNKRRNGAIDIRRIMLDR